MASLQLSGKQLRQFSEALRAAFPLQRLREVLTFRLERRLEDYSLGSDYQEIVFEVMTAAESEGWTAELLTAARQSNPGNAQLQAFAQEVGLAAVTPALERTIREQSPYLDVEMFRTRLAELENQVCRIEVATPRGTVYGTGFLVAPSLVMTNHHVMEQVIAGKVAPSATTLRFDYKRTSSATVSQGTTAKLAGDWLVDSSPPSEIDLKPEPKTGVPGANELDYALIRVEGEPGNDAAGCGADPKSPPRGWITLADTPVPPAESPLFILQHPDSAPLKLALDMTGVIGPNGNGTRVQYRVNTEGGSSGAPCFTPEWQLVALHHSGDPNFDPDHKPAYNEGIPVGAILKLLEERGKRAELG